MKKMLFVAMIVGFACIVASTAQAQSGWSDGFVKTETNVSQWAGDVSGSFGGGHCQGGNCAQPRGTFTGVGMGSATCGSLTFETGSGVTNRDPAESSVKGGYGVQGGAMMSSGGLKMWNSFDSWGSGSGSTKSQ
jgi:hypothetical protein